MNRRRHVDSDPFSIGYVDLPTLISVVLQIILSINDEANVRRLGRPTTTVIPTRATYLKLPRVTFPALFHQALNLLFAINVHLSVNIVEIGFCAWFFSLPRDFSFIGLLWGIKNRMQLVKKYGHDDYGLRLVRTTSFKRKRVALSNTICIDFDAPTPGRSALEDLPQEILVRWCYCSSTLFPPF